MATSGEAYGISVALYAGALLIIFVLFTYWRRLPYTKKFFAPKRFVSEEGYCAPPPIPPSKSAWFPGWVRHTAGFKEADIIAIAGVDAALYMRFLRLGLQVFVVTSFLVLAILLPINLTNNTVDELMASQGSESSTNSSTTNYYFTSLDKTTISNIPSRSSKLIAHSILTWVVTIIVLLMCWEASCDALRLRIMYLFNTPKGAETHTVLCTDIPGIHYGIALTKATSGFLSGLKASFFKVANKIRLLLNDDSAINVDTFAAPNRWEVAVKEMERLGSAGAMVESEFSKIYKNDLSAVHMVHDCSAIQPLMTEYENIVRAAEDLIDDIISKKKRGRPLDKEPMTTVIGPKYGAWGRERYGIKPVKVKSLDFYVERLQYLKTEIEEQQSKAMSDNSVWPAAFVSFQTRSAQVVAADTLMCEDLSTWKTQPAPRPQEVVWSNLGMRQPERSSRGTTMWVAFILLTTFYLIPVAAIQALLATNVSVSFIQDIPIVSSIITAILPGLVLTIFLAVLPSIITMMNRWAGMISLSSIDYELMSRFFIFQVVTVFFGSFIAGTVANQFKELINNPSSIVTLLGTAAPQTAIFFLTYVTLQGMFVSPFSILRLVPFIIFWAKTVFLAATERAKARLWQEQLFSYGTVVVNDTMMMLLGLTFCCICPLIAPAALVYFCTTFIVQKYNLIYVFQQSYQTGGLAWRNIHNQIMTGLFLFQLVMICLLALKKSIAAPIIIIPLPFITLYYIMLVRSTFWKPMRALSLMAATEIDSKEKLKSEGAEEFVATERTEVAKEEENGLYKSPNLRSVTQQCDQIITECERAKALLAGESDVELLERDNSKPSEGVEV